MTKELFVNDELTLSRKETYGKSKQSKSVPVFTSRMEKRDYYKGVNHFDIRNVIDVKGFLKDIRENWNTYVSHVHQWIQRNPVKKLIVTGIFTVVIGGYLTSTANAAFLQEYTYQVKNGEKIENIAKEHGVTPQEILHANGLTSIDGKKILLPKVEDRTVTASILNVRLNPNTKSSIIAKYKKGDIVKVAYIENGWAGILINGQVCFVSADYLAPKQVGSPTPSHPTTIAKSQVKTMYVTTSSLRVREKASMSSAVLGSLKLNSSVSVTSTMNGWAQIQFNGKTAFVSEAFLTNNKPTNNEPLKNDSTITSSSVYVIKSGDTITKISKALGVSVSSIQALNPTVDPSKLKIGQTIKVPTTPASTTNQIQVVAQLGGVDSQGTFRFITSDGSTYAAKASGNMLNELYKHQGKQVTLTLEGNRGQQMTLISLQ
ncbi:LysM peptidoglycan-binding domain-containing protein [Neobacillus massiliamazoniensis]|uniref:3D domain-containing protein n=1 Tax=Neobacillus massiliamazoniensis TaxID=1499688 RepID=A0A0U1NUW0_9BACI|nr:LysM peptidoglycan-binding domain-containing protein [Neobacillus massiliamazoniensis]CRK81806.1 3D domain-containing protein [Neobacillus massiliamazoniensis]